MTDETMRLAAQITAGLTEEMFNHNGPHRIEGHEYAIATDEQYEALGEDVTATDLPLILCRRSDGKFFEVELDAMVYETTPVQRKSRAEQLRQYREQTEARKARKS
jgi:hypothetical protein